MAQRNSEYTRVPGDLYVTPEWVWAELRAVEPWALLAFDCAPVNPRFDFLDPDYVPPSDWLAANPPYGKAEAFCRKALSVADRVAMLLPHAFDSAKGRVDLWEHPFKAKYTLTKRIRWDNLEQKKNGPSSNHAWFVWDSDFERKPFMGWLPKAEAA